MTNKIMLLLLILTGSIFALERENIIDKWLNSELSNKEFIEITLDEVKKIKPTDYQSYLHLSVLYMNIGQAWHGLGNKEKSIEYLELAKVQAKKSVELRETDEGWRLLADTGSYIMVQKGVAYIIQNSGKVKEHAQKSLKLNKDNARAALVDAQGLINAPKIFGGNKMKGIQILTELAKRSDLTNEDSFYMKVSLAEALLNNKKPEVAKEVILEALKIYPNNKRANELLKSL